MKKYVLMIMNLVIYIGATFLVFDKLGNYLYYNFEWYSSLFEQNIPLELAFLSCINMLVYLLIFYVKKIFLKERYESLWSVCNFSMLTRKQMILFTFIGLAGTFWFISFMKISFIGEKFPDLEEYIEIFSTADNFFYVFLGVGIAGVFIEEILGRGLIFNELKKVMSLPTALLLNALIYGYLQPSPIIMFTGFMLGILYGLVYFKTQSLWSSIWIGIVLNVSMFTFNELNIIDITGRLPDLVLVLITISTFLFIIFSVILLFKNNSLSNDTLNTKNSNIGLKG
ncbi:CPBP family intramembrane glutamic endopeptidase [Chengkuizengella sediminis]|uniref:CPBP family intramembrane glutamic endopeptidase n=1 Tax=Chengkuizengella sediminis TaxID=1885917 RepID=UPI001389E7C4|nr:CPBP family intramembrane glutamic endopeptidase [Chengkuizengella sediminis]NDI34047.1 CPBP family intramembrane metalloprotease [Chengkuizengella sediminis]